METAVIQQTLKHPDFIFEEVATEILDNTCVPNDLTAAQCERVFDSLVMIWSIGKGYEFSSAVHVTLVRTLMKMHGDRHVLLQNYIDTYNDLDEIREAGGNVIAALEKYIAAAIAYGDDELEKETSELQKLLRERAKSCQLAA
jgi:hypothetical protein